MADFSRAWNEASPAGTDDASAGDNEIRNLKVEISDRLKTLIYGFIAGEDTDAPGVKNLIFKQQAAAPGTPNADEISLYAIDYGGKPGLYAKQEDGYVKLILERIGTDILFYLSDQVDQSTIGLSSGVLEVKDDGITGAKMSATFQFTDLAKGKAGTDPTHDDHLARKKYVNDQVAAITDPAYTGGESHTFEGGLIVKSGYVARAGTETTVTFGAAFSNAVVSATISPEAASSTDNTPTIKSLSTTALVIVHSTAWTGFYWEARGY